MERPMKSDTKHIPALDGLRAIAILMIVWYHFWQQSWLSPSLSVRLPFGSRAVFVSLDILPRTGYLFVDLLLLLSAFCLFLPHARSMVYGDPVPSVRGFYKKRLVRIVPPYYLSALLLFCYALLTRAYGTAGEAIRDLLATLSFTQVFSPRTYLGTKINGVLWTAAVEMQFYLLFPLLARCFRKKPLLTYLSMLGASLLFVYGVSLPRPERLRMLQNQLPAFLSVFANGMAAAYVYTLSEKQLAARPIRLLPLFLLPVIAFSLVLLNRIRHGAAGAELLPAYQMAMRYPLSLVFTLLLLALSFSGRVGRALLGNRILRFFAAISYELYIWHQWIAVRLKEWRIPYWAGDALPNMTGDRPWQIRYTVVVFFVAIAAAALLTYCYERPVSRLLLRGSKNTTKEV